MRSACGILGGFTDAIATGLVPVATIVATLAAFAALSIALAAGIQRLRGGSARPRETLFVGRWGVLGPELYVVGKDVRRLPGSQEHAALALARRMLAEVMRCRPATPLAQALADARLDPLPPEGFVLSKSDVEAWLETRRAHFEPAESGDSP
jgi:hypothetical protein